MSVIECIMKIFKKGKIMMMAHQIESTWWPNKWKYVLVLILYKMQQADKQAPRRSEAKQSWVSMN